MSSFLRWPIVCALILGVGVAGCSQESATQVISRKALDRRILQLQQGASVESVEAELGGPVSEFTESPERSALHYGPWLLLFNGQGLERRIRQRKPSHRPSISFTGAFDSKVLMLRLGMSLDAVRSKLGQPQWYEEVFEGSAYPEKVLRYGPWELSFSQGELARRTRF